MASGETRSVADHRDRPYIGGARNRYVPVDAVHAEIAVGGLHDNGDVDVGGDRLGGGTFPAARRNNTPRRGVRSWMTPKSRLVGPG